MKQFKYTILNTIAITLVICTTTYAITPWEDKYADVDNFSDIKIIIRNTVGSTLTPVVIGVYWGTKSHIILRNSITTKILNNTQESINLGLTVAKTWMHPIRFAIFLRNDDTNKMYYMDFIARLGGTEGVQSHSQYKFVLLTRSNAYLSTSNPPSLKILNTVMFNEYSLDANNGMRLINHSTISETTPSIIWDVHEHYSSNELPIPNKVKTYNNDLGIIQL